VRGRGAVVAPAARAGGEAARGDDRHRGRGWSLGGRILCPGRQPSRLAPGQPRGRHAVDEGRRARGRRALRTARRVPVHPRARLREEHREQTDDEPGVVVVLDGATDDEAEQLTESLGPAVTVVPDPDGALAGAVGVRFWPTTVAMDDLNEGRG